MKKVDKLGRIVIPQELRQKYGLYEGVEIEILDVGEGITVRAADAFCRVCHKRIPESLPVPLCEACVKRAAGNYSKK